MIRVLHPGPLTAVRDLGHAGFAHLGVSAGGAADTVSLRVGNRLVGNPDDAAALEMTLAGGRFLFHVGATVAITGSDFRPTVDGREVPLWESFTIRAGATLRVGSTRTGARCYLCLSGGLNSPPLPEHMVCKGDLLGVGAARGHAGKRHLRPEWLRRDVLRVTAGPQATLFDDPARQTFFDSFYRVREESDRRGLRLTGPAIAPPHGGRMITEGVSLGAIQLPPNGEPIILFVGQQTTGGYPIVANVISADLHRVGQLRPRDRVRFELVDMDTARELLAELERSLEP